MITLDWNQLIFSFPEVHPKAKLGIYFERTLRIPQGEKDFVLPALLGDFPVLRVDDYSEAIPKHWRRHGGVMLPMYQSEAMWLNFDCVLHEGYLRPYPFAVKIAAGKCDAVTGQDWRRGLHREPQDYVVAPRQRWFDGMYMENEVVEQFVAMPLRAGCTGEEQLEGEAVHDSVQITVYPMKPEVFEERVPEAKNLHSPESLLVQRDLCAPSFISPICIGRLRQEICPDPFHLEEWDLEHGSSCFIHIANSLTWLMITDEIPPTSPWHAGHYTRYGVPWLECYDDLRALEGTETHDRLKDELDAREEVARPIRFSRVRLRSDDEREIDAYENLVREGKW